MKKILILSLIVIFGTITAFSQSDFVTQQKRYKRVRAAFRDKEELVTQRLKKIGVTITNLNILMIAYKEEGKLVIFAKNKSDLKYKKLAAYNICSKSGKLGPKRKQGDYQVPEGFYYIDRFNPVSNFYLSLGINYPNFSDKRKSKAKKLGGDIFIHGSCVTIGCLPMTNDKIKEIYLYAINAKNNGQKRIPVYIFPFKMDTQNFNKHKISYEDNPELLRFWINIKQGYDKFIKENKELKITVKKSGDYLIR